MLFTNFDLSGTANLSAKSGACGPVYFKFTAVDGCAPTAGEIVGDGKLLDTAWHEGHATLAMLDISFAVTVLGRSNRNGALIVESAPLFRALVARVHNAA
jgi:hypothetical protein